VRELALILSTALAVWSASASSANAQTEADIEQARAAFERGETLFGEGNYFLALESFQRSHALLDGFPRQHLVLFNIARCQEELGQFADALETFERYLREGGADRDNADETRRRVEELRRRVEAAENDARAPASGGVDGLLVGGLVLGVTGGLAGIASLATGLTAHDLYTGLEERCMPADNCPPGSASDISTGSALAWTSTILLPVSVAALGAGAVLLVLSAVGGDGDAEQADLQLRPTLGGAELRGRF
jgi:tetratricopeptide (TPR) repeat protein